MSTTKEKKPKKPTAKQIVINLANLYYNTDYGWFPTAKRDYAIKQYIDQLWQIHGLAEEGEQPMGVYGPINRGIGST